MSLSPRIAGAAVGALAALGFGGASLAWAQEAPTAPPTEAPAEDATPPADKDDRPEDGDRSTAGAASTDQISL